MRITLTTGALLGSLGTIVLGLALGATPAAAQNTCLIGLANGNDAPLSGTVTCNDGDPTCDTDATVGTCTFQVKGCVNVVEEGCEPTTLKKATVAPKKLGIAVAPNGSTTTCSEVTPVVVKLKKKNKKAGQVRITLNAKSDGKPPRKDKEKVTLVCNPTPAACPNNPANGPDQLTLTVAETGNDLDTGFSGQSHNFINVPGATLNYCLSECDASTNPVCKASGSTGDGSLNGKAFGPPLPLFSAGVAVCVVNEFALPTIDATVNVQTGAFDASSTPVVLNSKTHQGSPDKVCPRCVAGKCDSGARQGQPCVVNGSVIVNNPPNVINAKYDVSADCLPSSSALLGTPVVNLGLTTETSTLAGNANGNGFPCPGQSQHDSCGASATCTVPCPDKADPKGGINQMCCSNAVRTPCFPTDPETGIGKIERQGSVTPAAPVWPDPTYPKEGSGVLASAFCIASTNSIAVDSTAGLPGPGALLLPGTHTIKENPAP